MPGHTCGRTQITPFRGCTGGHAHDRIATPIGGEALLDGRTLITRC
jgi:hypothetical protein